MLYALRQLIGICLLIAYMCAYFFYFATGITCPPGSAACLFNPNEDTSKKLL